MKTKKATITRYEKKWNIKGIIGGIVAVVGSIIFFISFLAMWNLCMNLNNTNNETNDYYVEITDWDRNIIGGIADWLIILFLIPFLGISWIESAYKDNNNFIIFRNEKRKNSNSAFYKYVKVEEELEIEMSK